MDCPSDHHPLASADVEGFEIHHCAACAGSFVPADFFRQIRAAFALEIHKRRGSATVDVAGLSSDGLYCVRDGHLMTSLTFKGVEIDVCSSCFGLWLSDGKFAKLVELVGGPRKPDLSKLGRSLARIGNGAGTVNIESVSDVVDLAEDVLSIVDGISNFSS